MPGRPAAFGRPPQRPLKEELEAADIRHAAAGAPPTSDSEADRNGPLSDPADAGSLLGSDGSPANAETLAEPDASPASPDEDPTSPDEATLAAPPVARDVVQASAMAPVVGADWLASVCPYLASEDGTYRSATADEGHRCTAQDPPATLPLAFQERFCLTERHPRCEMYKFAQETGTTESVPPAELEAVGTRPLRVARASASGGRGVIDRRVIAGGAGLGGLAVLVVVLVLLMSSCSGDPSGTTDDGATPDPQATGGVPATPRPTRTPAPAPTTSASVDPSATAEPTVEAGDSGFVIRYQIQEGEALLKVADTFGVSRRRLYRMNEGLEDIAPAALPGEVILVPVPASMTIEEVEALLGYLGPAE